MEISDFIYHRPSDLREACALLSELGERAHVLAGGTEVLVDLKQHTFETRHLVSLRDLAELRGIEVDGRGLRVGAMATQAMVARSETVRESFPALAEAASTMAAVQVRNRGTIGGNFCSAVPSADLPPICIAGSAEVRLAGPEGERSVPADRFFAGARRSVRRRGEVLVEVRVPAKAWAPGTGAAYEKFGLRDASALAVAGAAAWVRIEGGKVSECRIALGAVHPTPLLAADASGSASGRVPSAELFREAGERASRECSPIDDLRGSSGYRRDLVRVLVARALERACARAGGERGDG